MEAPSLSARSRAYMIPVECANPCRTKRASYVSCATWSSQAWEHMYRGWYISRSLEQDTLVFFFLLTLTQQSFIRILFQHEGLQSYRRTSTAYIVHLFDIFPCTLPITLFVLVVLCIEKIGTRLVVHFRNHTYNFDDRNSLILNYSTKPTLSKPGAQGT